MLRMVAEVLGLEERGAAVAWAATGKVEKEAKEKAVQEKAGVAAGKAVEKVEDLAEARVGMDWVAVGWVVVERAVALVVLAEMAAGVLEEGAGWEEDAEREVEVEESVEPEKEAAIPAVAAILVEVGDRPQVCICFAQMRSMRSIQQTKELFSRLQFQPSTSSWPV